MRGRAQCAPDCYQPFTMPKCFRLGLAVLAACGMLAGCARRELQPEKPGLLPPPVVVADLVGHGPVRPDVSGLGTLVETQQRLPPHPLEGASRDLSAEETQSLAAANSKLANLFELEGQAVSK